MLLELRIEDFAIVEHCVLGFDAPFTVLTGETGAGKSILVDALSATLGSRVGPDAVRHGAPMARCEAVFATPSGDEAVRLLEEHGVEPDEMLVLTREISAAGRGMARVNGRPVPVGLLGRLAALLVDIHGQSEHLSILKPSRQLDMLDDFAGLRPLRDRFAGLARSYVEARSALEELRAGQRSAEQKLDLLRFQVEEISGAGLELGELERLQADRSRLANAEKLAQLSSQALAALQGDGVVEGAVDRLGELSRCLSRLAEVDPTVATTVEGADELRFAAEDLAVAVRAYRDAVEFDPPRLELTESRLHEIARLQRKYGESIEEILEFRDQAAAELEGVERYEERLQAAGERLRDAERQVATVALELTAQRADAADRFSSAVHERLAQLGLGPARFEIRLQHVEDAGGLPLEDDDRGRPAAFTASGIDQIQYLVSFNAGEPVRPIERIASGGETARFMLAIKAVLAAADAIPTLIFDEVDTGIGGRSGRVVGDMLRELSAHHQVIAITHLPQIAALGSRHLRVGKREEEGRTTVTVEPLEGERRLEELAEMLAGADPGEQAIRSAEELLAAAR